MCRPKGYAINLVQGQDNVTIGIGEPGLDNSVVVLVLAAEGEAGADGLEGIRCFPGTALAGRRRLVSAAAHSLILSRIGLTGDPEGRVEVWVLRAARFLELNPQDFDKEMLRSRGAVRARAQHSRVKDEHIADRDNVHNSIPRGIDTVYLELYEDLELPPNQPRILKVNEAVQMAGYLGSPGISASYLEMVINGMGDHYSTGNRGEPGEAMAVQWQPVTPGKWMFSRTNMAAAGALSSSLSKALKGCRQPGICGVLELKDIWCPGGFSGGGAYVKVPAVALDPNSGPGAEDTWVLLGNIVASSSIQDAEELGNTFVKFLTQAELESTPLLRALKVQDDVPTSKSICRKNSMERSRGQSDVP